MNHRALLPAMSNPGTRRIDTLELDLELGLALHRVVFREPTIETWWNRPGGEAERIEMLGGERESYVIRSRDEDPHLPGMQSWLSLTGAFEGWIETEEQARQAFTTAQDGERQRQQRIRVWTRLGYPHDGTADAKQVLQDALEVAGIVSLPGAVTRETLTREEGLELQDYVIPLLDGGWQHGDEGEGVPVPSEGVLASIEKLRQVQVDRLTAGTELREGEGAGVNETATEQVPAIDEATGEGEASRMTGEFVPPATTEEPT